ANSAGQNNEDGVRTNADYAFICAFLYTHGQNVTLPSGITMADVKDMAIKALTWAYSTHRANQLKLCTNNAYWGSSMKTGVYTWESSMWAESVAYATWLLGDELNATQKAYAKAMIMDEANYEVSRDIPSGYTDDTKAEENGWDTNILACAAAMYPDEPNADAWYNKMRQFAMNSYSVNQDKYDYSLADGKRVRDWYIGTNLWDDYTLQNHAFFHTSYQNIAIQELSESFMALKAMQEGSTAKRKFPLSETLKHNVKPMWNNVLKKLALADGELAMPNGNDWSMFLYDQLASYTAMATIYRDPDALMLENMAFKYTRARQQTTSDGSWMLNSDIGPRRMGVTGRRVVMTYLYHKYFSTTSLTPSSWTEFSSREETTKYFPFVNVIRSQTSDRFTAFSWATSKASYTGMIATSSPDKNKIFIPYRNSNTGNFTGIFKQGSTTLGATPVVSGYYGMYPKSYYMNGNLTMGSLLNQRFVLYSTSGNAVIYLYNLNGAASGTLNMEGGAAMAVSTDPFTKETRTLYYERGNLQSNGSTLNSMSTNWVNIDNEVGVVAKNDDLKMAFGSRSLVNSIYTSILYPCYSETPQAYTTSTRKERNAVYYSNVDAETTAKLANQLQSLKLGLGWNGIIAADPNGTHYLVAANFTGSVRSATPITVTCPLGAPVFNKETTIENDSATTTFYCTQNYSVANELKVFVRGATLTAVQKDENPEAAYLENNSDAAQTAQVSIVTGGKTILGEVAIESGKTVYVSVKEDVLQSVEVAQFPGSYRNVAFGTHAYAYSQLPGNLPFNVLDGDKDTYYQSVTDPSTGNEYLTFRLRNSYLIDKIIITPRAGYAPKDITIQTSLSDSYSGTAATATLQDSGEAQEISFDSRTARFVRIKINSGYGNQVGIYEVKIMGTPNTLN
ncbi:MAG: discoidin domain-containing protein, partial [Bacteroidaceae bacterium]